jgi:hypothetical protein
VGNNDTDVGVQKKDAYFLTTILCLLPESSFVGYINKILRTHNSLKAVSILKM